MTHCYRKYKFQPFTETFSLLPYSLCWMTCLDSYALPHLMLENTLLVGYQYWFYALYCQHYERCNVMDTFHLSSWAGRLRGCYARTSHSSIVFVYWQVFVADCPCLLGNSDYVLWLVLFCMVHGVRDFKVCLVFLVGLLSFKYVWVIWRF